MTGPASEQPEARRLQDFLEDSLELDEESFRKRHGNAFLLHGGAIRLSAEVKHTETGGALGGRKKVKFSRPRTDYLVFPVRKRGESSSSGFISVGRAEKNDVVVPDVSLTRVHAFFKQSDDGRFFFLDGASKNGTFLNDEIVPAWGEGEPAELASGDRVRFGSMEFTFLEASEFRYLAKRISDK